MTIFQNPSQLTSFLRSPLVERVSDLQIPRHPPGAVAQPNDLPKGLDVLIYTPDRLRSGLLTVVGLEFDKEKGRLHRMQLLSGGDEFTRISDYQLALLESESRLEVRTPGVAGKLVKSPTGLTPEQVAAAEVMRGYVHAAISQGFEEGKDTTPGVINRAIEKHAIEAGDTDPPCDKTVKKYIKRAAMWPAHDLRAFVRASPPGKTEGDYPKQFEELLAQCIIAVWGRSNPTRKKVKRLLTLVLLRAEYDVIRGRVLNPKGFLIPSPSYFDRAMAQFNKYDKAREKYGKIAASKQHGGKSTRALPSLPLDVVEVDYTPLNMIATDSRWGFVYGRPNLIMFRDKATAAVLGFSIFFDNLSFEAFFHGFRQAIYPKNMARYPAGWRWLMFGVPVTLVIDNESHLATPEVLAALTSLGMNVYQARVEKPTDKGGIEQMFAKTQEAVIHDLPGSVHANPEARHLYDKEKLAGLPHHDLDYIEAKVTEWICLEHHPNPKTGLGFTRRMSDIPERLWIQDIGKASQKNIINPEEFLRVAGNRFRVQIRGNTVIHDYVEYESPLLGIMTADGRHKQSVAGQDNTEYWAFRNPSEMGVLYIENPYDDCALIEVPAGAAYRKYATGLRRYQHERVVALHNRLFKSPISGISDLEVALLRLESDLEEAAKRVGQKAKQEFAAYHSDLSERRKFDRIVDVPTSKSASSVRLDPGNPIVAPPVRNEGFYSADNDPVSTPDMIWAEDSDGNLVKTDPLASQVEAHLAATPKNTETYKVSVSSLVPVSDDIDDLEELLNLHKGYER